MPTPAGDLTGTGAEALPFSVAVYASEARTASPDTTDTDGVEGFATPSSANALLVYVRATALSKTDAIATLTIDAAGGTYTVTYSAQETGNIDFDATAAEVQAALEALSNIAPGDVVVTGDDGGPYTLTFGGELADADINLTTDATNLTGGAGTAVVADVVVGGADPSVVFNIEGYDKAADHWYTILASAAVTTAAPTESVLRVWPGPTTATANAYADDILPEKIRVRPVHDNTASITYSVGAHFSAA